MPSDDLAPEKLILTHRGNLTAKYGKAGRVKLERALERLRKADERRGIPGRVVYLDDRVQMRGLSAKHVSRARSRAQFKRSVDDLAAAHDPSYLLLVGAPDVIPHQSLFNPMGGAGGDGDSDVPSDLPYACDASGSRAIEDYLGPSRVVGRLPDLNGEDNPRYLSGLLTRAARWKADSPTGFRKSFTLSAEVWKRSSRKSSKRLFDTQRIEMSPPKGPAWSESKLRRKVHFINCHGALEDERFFGEDQHENFPEALLSRRLKGVQEGSVVAAECCYGSTLYAPSELGIPMPICNAYLARGASGFMGSTTVAYGPANGNGAADLLCLYFIKHVQRGASLGRAMLLARQEFIRRCGPLDPVELKTVAQFLLLGDPSIHPVRSGTTPVGAQAAARKQKTMRKKRFSVSRVASDSRARKQKTLRTGRKNRRRSLVNKGQRLALEVPSCKSKPIQDGKLAMSKALQRHAKKLGLDGRMRSFEMRAVSGPLETKSKAGARRKARKRPATPGAKAMHLMIEGGVKRDHHVSWKRVLVARQVGSRLQDVREYLPR